VKRPECPCGSQLRYTACCKVFHGGGVAPTAEALMRSRFSAFALGEDAYLLRTLDPEHPDRCRPEREALVELRASRRGVRYVRLRILDAEEARVLFHAELYESGRERSFAELSEFRREGAEWRYWRGEARGLRAAEAERLRFSTWTAASAPEPQSPR